MPPRDGALAFNASLLYAAMNRGAVLAHLRLDKDLRPLVAYAAAYFERPVLSHRWFIAA